MNQKKKMFSKQFKFLHSLKIYQVKNKHLKKNRVQIWRNAPKTLCVISPPRFSPKGAELEHQRCSFTLSLFGCHPAFTHANIGSDTPEEPEV